MTYVIWMSRSKAIRWWNFRLAVLASQTATAPPTTACATVSPKTNWSCVDIAITQNARRSPSKCAHRLNDLRVLVRNRSAERSGFCAKEAAGLFRRTTVPEQFRRQALESGNQFDFQAAPLVARGRQKAASRIVNCQREFIFKGPPALCVCHGAMGYVDIMYLFYQIGTIHKAP